MTTTPALSLRGVTRSYGENTTRVYGDEAAPPVRPALGTPTSPARSTPSRGTDDTEVVDDDAVTKAFGDTDRVTPARGTDRPAPSTVATPAPTSADAHVNRTPANDVPTAPGTPTTPPG